MNIESTLTFIVLAMLLGMLGQGARTVVGIKKAMDESKTKDDEDSWFNSRRLVVSIFIGMIAGGLAGLALLGGTVTSSELPSREILLSILAAGYAGTDFIEGFMRARVVPTEKDGKKQPAKVETATGEVRS